jgi:hypothetical protein
MHDPIWLVAAIAIGWVIGGALSRGYDAWRDRDR